MQLEKNIAENCGEQTLLCDGREAVVTTLMTAHGQEDWRTSPADEGPDYPGDCGDPNILLR